MKSGEKYRAMISHRSASKSGGNLCHEFFSHSGESHKPGIKSQGENPNLCSGSARTKKTLESKEAIFCNPGFKIDITLCQSSHIQSQN